MKSQASHDITVIVPRHGTLPPAKNVLNAAKTIVEQQGGVLKANESVDPHSPEGESVANASEWNSMLLTARAVRGPQWDVASQLFQVDKESQLYYGFTPLMSADGEAESVEQPAPPSQLQTPSRQSFASPSPSYRRTPADSYNPNTPNNGGTATPPSMRLDAAPSSGRRVTRGSMGRDYM